MIYTLVAVVVGGVALCAGGAMSLLGAVGTSPCTLPIAPTAAPSAVVGSYDSEQVANATTIVSAGAQQGVPVRGWIIAVAVALQESALRNIAGGDRDSLGLFQQRPSQGWGTPAQLLDPTYASTKFYQKLLAVADWQGIPLTVAAQQVQISAYPDAYAKWETDATRLVKAVASGNPSAISGSLNQCVSVCPAMTSSRYGVADTCADVSVVFARAKSWLTAWTGGPVPYLSSNAPADLLGGYRRDCSGYVSMALGLPGPGLNTIGLAERSTIIAKTDLRPGDLMINPDTDLRGHVVLFTGWADASMTSYHGYEQSGDDGTHFRTIPYPYFGTYSMTPYRPRLPALGR